MTIDTIAARNKRIKHLEAQRVDDAAAIKGLTKRVQAAEAKLARAERLAEAAKEVLRFVGDVNCSGYKCRLPQCSDCNMQAESEQPAVSEVEEALIAFS